jgi:Flp pilus assembly protein TadD
MSEKNDENRRRAAEIISEAAHVFYVGRYEEALSLFEEAVTLDDTAVRAYTGKSLALAQLGRPEEGLASAEKALEIEPAYATAYTALAICLHRLGRAEDAKAAYIRALEIDPNDVRVLYNYACFWAEQGNEARCREFVARAFQEAQYEEIAHVHLDPDLARYVNTDWFRELLAQAKKRHNEAGQ